MVEDAPFRILALSGGGVRGLFQAHYLSLVQQELDTPLTELFDLCIGTSIGSVSAAAIALGINPSELIELYRSHVSKIFGSGGIGLAIKAYISRGPLFDRSHLDRALKNLFGDHTLEDCKSGFVCTAGELSTYSHRIFSTYDGLKITKKVKVRDAVGASCSVPIFLAPHEIDSLSDHFVDGGIWANSPEALGIHIAVGQLGVPVEDIELVSVGTGISPQGTLESELRKVRPASLRAAMIALDMYSASQFSFAESSARHDLSINRYISINPVLKSAIPLYDYKIAEKELPALAASEFNKSFSTNAKFFKNKRPYRIDRAGKRHEELIEMINISGLNRIVPSRKYYGVLRNGAGSIGEYIGRAERSIEMVSISLSTGLMFENIFEVLKRKLLSSSDFSVRISLVNPNIDYLIRTVTASVSHEHQEMTPEQLAGDIRRALGMLINGRGKLPADAQARLFVGVHSALPQGSAIILDRGTVNAAIQVETKPYGLPLTASYAIEAVPAGPDALYSTFLKAYSDLLDHAIAAENVLGLRDDKAS